jgi:hypothetical protein
MSPRRSTLSPLLLLFAVATTASAQDDPRSPAAPGIFPPEFEQVVYKGVVGNVLDAIPMDPSQRVDLQRTNAVLSNTLLGRSLALLAGLSNPVLLLGGFVWGMWAAANIKPAEAGIKLAADQGQSGDSTTTNERNVALLHRSSGADDAVVNRVPEPAIFAISIIADDSHVVAVSPPHVIKIWLSQPSSTLAR